MSTKGRPRRLEMAFLFSEDFLEDSRFGSRCLSPTNRTRQLTPAPTTYKSNSCKRVVSVRRERAMVVVLLPSQSHRRKFCKESEGWAQRNVTD